MQILPNVWNYEEYRLGEDFIIARPSPRTLVLAGWKLTKKLDDLPSAPGVYLIHGGGDGLQDKYLYVGQAKHLRERLSGHPAWKRACLEYPKPAVFYWDFQTVTRRELLRYETYMIVVTNPLWNFGERQETFHAVPSFNGLWD